MLIKIKNLFCRLGPVRKDGTSMLKEMENIYAPRRETCKPLRELSQGLLICNAINSGCVEPNAHCIRSDGPSHCTAHESILNCPFGKGRLSLDEEYIEERMAKLRELHDRTKISRAEYHIRRARVGVKREEVRLNSEMFCSGNL